MGKLHTLILLRVADQFDVRGATDRVQRLSDQACLDLSAEWPSASRTTEAHRIQRVKRLLTDMVELLGKDGFPGGEYFVRKGVTHIAVQTDNTTYADNLFMLEASGVLISRDEEVRELVQALSLTVMGSS